MFAFNRAAPSAGVTSLGLSGPPPSCRRLVVILVRPSRYDDEGYVVRHWRGVLPSNTLSCLNSLTEDAVRHGALGTLDVHVEVIDEVVSRVDPARLGRRFRHPGTSVVVGLVGVQTNQFPRALDLARLFKAEGFAVMIGGFHVSGAIAMSPDGMPPECRQAIDDGITLVLGEVEDRWAGLLRDAAAGTLQPLYDFLGDKPDLRDKPLPRASRRTQRKFTMQGGGTIDAGRGCPFQCSFCTIINVQGRRMRCRSAAQILAQIQENYVRAAGGPGVRHYFFTDDNFARNPEWEAIFDGLIELRERGVSIDFMMQVDVLAPRVPRFVEKAARAGCVQVFIGMETIRADNLDAGGKRQNKAADYREMIAAWHREGVVCHAGYIIGFPHDTYERVMEDVRTLRDELLVDQASFFMLTPLPGSEDHRRARQDGVPMDPDYNNFDAFHSTTPHPRMSGGEWDRAYRDAWSEFYTPEAMRRTLLRQNPHTYWGVLKNQIWYRAAMIERAHPMVTGFFRLKDRRSRRASFPMETRRAFAARRVRETAYILREYAKLYLEMQELWLRSRIRREDYAFLGDLRKLAARSRQDAKVNWARVHLAVAERAAAWREAHPSWKMPERMAERLEAVRQAAGARAGVIGDALGQRAAAVGASVTTFRAALADLRLRRLPPLAERGRFVRAAGRLNLLSTRHLEAHPGVWDYWTRTWSAALHLRLWRVNPVEVSRNLARDTRQAVVFFLALMRETY